MFNLNSLFKAKPTELKVKASNNFLDSLNNIGDIRVTDHARITNVEEKVTSVKENPKSTIQDVIRAKPQGLKVMASNNFLDSLNSIQDIRVTKVKERDQSREEISKTNFQEAMAIIKRLTREKNFNLAELKIAANKLIVSIENNKNNAEAYINLALIFYVIKNIPSAIRYLKISRSINPELPEIKKLEKLISNQGFR